MRLWILAAMGAALCGCSLLDQAVLSGPSLGSNKIFLDDSRVNLPRRELDRYACASGPMVCELTGASFNCGCLRH